MRAEPVRAGAVASIDRLSARRKSRKRKARVVRTKRSAILALRSCSVELAPADPVHRSKPPILLQGVLVEKERTPKGAAPIKWVLLTTLAADTPEACRRIAEYYARRWRIKDWHRVLKSRRNVEEIENRTVERIAHALPPSTSSSPGASC